MIMTSFVYPGAQPIGGAHFGQGSGSIFLDNVACNGYETSLISCPYTTPTSSDNHLEDAGVRCPGNNTLFMFTVYKLICESSHNVHLRQNLANVSLNNILG